MTEIQDCMCDDEMMHYDEDLEIWRCDGCNGRVHNRGGWDDDGFDEDSYEAMLSRCGMMRDGLCLYAGSEYCDWDCQIPQIDERLDALMDGDSDDI